MTTLFLSQKHYKDSKNNVFCIDIDENNKDTWERDIKKGWKEISKEEAELIANPPPTKEQLISDAELRKQTLLSEATGIIDPLIDAVDLGMSTLEEELALKAWKKYRVLLSRVDTSLAPDIEWPVKPQSSF